MIGQNYAEYAWEMTETLLSIDSPSGYTSRAAAWVKEKFESLGFKAEITTKGGVLIDLGGEKEDDQLVDGVHEGHAADGGGAEVGHHHGVHGADETCEQLFDDEGDKQLPQIAV